MKVLVCGGRDYGLAPPSSPLNGVARHRANAERQLVTRHLDAFHRSERGPITEIIQGGANGADFLARAWAARLSVNCTTFNADWRDGKKAGPQRNRRMLEQGRPAVVIAFDGGPGTKNMVGQAMKAGVEVIQVPGIPKLV